MKKKTKKIKFNIKRIIFWLFIVLVIIFLFIKNKSPKEQNILNIIDNSITNSSEYSILKQDSNPNYLGVGQEKVNNKDGYFTTFTTNNNKIYKEYKQNGNSSWSNHSYWDNTMASDRLLYYCNFYYFKWLWKKYYS